MESNKCKMCDFTLIYTKRERKCDEKDDTFGERWHVRLNEDEETGEEFYDIIVDYDCGYACTATGHINYCPMCGRKLDDRE